MLTLSELICKSRGIIPEPGTVSGTCVFCGCETDNGHSRKVISDNFTAWDRLGSGDVVCPGCNHIYTTRLYKNMWAVNETEFRELKKVDLKQVLLTPPKPPFIIYLTQTYKTQGWLNLINRVQESKTNYVIGFDYNLIRVDTKKLEEYCNLITELLEKKIMKTELSTGQLKAKSYEKLGYDMELIEKIKTLVGNPLWDLTIFVS
mgnify:CR=1 FL=1